MRSCPVVWHWSITIASVHVDIDSWRDRGHWFGFDSLRNIVSVQVLVNNCIQFVPGQLSGVDNVLQKGLPVLVNMCTEWDHMTRKPRWFITSSLYES